MEVGVEVWVRDDAAPSGWKSGIIKNKQLVKSDPKKAILTVVSSDSPRTTGGKILSPKRTSPLSKSNRRKPSPRNSLGSAVVGPFKHKITVDTREESDVVKLKNNVRDLYADDLTSLPLLNEPAILHSLHLRFKKDVIYTSIGDVLIAINPFKRLTVYSDEKLSGYQSVGETGPRNDDTRLPPHIFQTADDAFQGLLQSFKEGTPKDMSILVSGESGSGKTWTSKIAMKYLAVLSSKQQKKLESFPSSPTSKISLPTVTSPTGHTQIISPKTKVQSATLEMQVLQSNPILEAFGNARTIRNDNSSRFGKFIEIGFTNQGVLSGAQIETYLLEKSRVLAQSDGERNFHVFYLLLSGADKDTLEVLDLNSTDASDFLITNDLHRRDGVKDSECFTEMTEAFAHLDFKEKTTLSILKLVAAILHLSKVTFEVGNEGGEGESSSIAPSPAAHSACRLLGISMDTLSMGVCYKTINVMKEVVKKPLNVESAKKSVHALMTTIYSSLFSTIVDKINASISVESGGPDSSKAASISILDIFGFESFESNHFEQLMINFTNETLQQQFNREIFKREQELYVAENIAWNFIDFPDNTDVLTLLDGRYPSIMSILDEQCVIPKSSDAKFARSLYKHLLEKDPFAATRVEQGNCQFTVHHYAREVCYDADGFLAKNTDDIGNSLTVINSSELPLLKDIAVSIEKQKSSTVTIGKRKTSVSAGRKFSNSLKSLRLRIEETKPIFVRCIKPNDDLVCDKFQARNVVEQLRCSGVLSAVEVSRAGYSNRFTHQRFMDRFYMIDPKVKSLATLLETSATRIFEPTDRCPSVGQFRNISGDLNPKLMHVGIQLGKTLVFLKRTAFEKLEHLRSVVLGASATKIQAKVRRNITRAKYLATIAAVILSQSLARVVLAKLVVRRMKAQFFVALHIQKRFRGQVGRRIAFEAREAKRVAAAATVVQAGMRRKLAIMSFMGTITNIIVAQKIARGYLVRVDPQALRESLILRQMELEKELLQKQLEDARKEEEAAEAAELMKQLSEEEAQAGKHPILFCIATAQWSRVREMLSEDPTLATVADKRGGTAAHYLFNVEVEKDSDNEDPHICRDMTSRVSIFKLLHELSPGCLKSKDTFGNTPIHIGAKWDAALPLLELVSTEYDPEGIHVATLNILEQHPVHIAVMSDAAENVKFLASVTPRGISHQDTNGNNAIHLACLHRASSRTIETLLGACDDLEKMLILEKENKEGFYPLTVGIARNVKCSTLTLLVTTKHSVLTSKDLFMAAEKGLKIDSLEMLLEKYVERTENDNTAVLDNFGRHPLHIAVASGVSLEATELWIKMFPNSTTHIDTLSNKLPIEISCESEAEEEVILLLLRRCSGVTFKRSLGHIASKTEDKFVGVLTKYLEGSTQEHRLKCAVMRTGPKNSKLVSCSTPACKQAFKTSLRYLGRYELSAVPVHRNEETGIEIFRAVDYNIDDSTKTDVVLKFTKEMSNIENEIYARKKVDPKKISTVLNTHATSTGFVVTFENVTTLAELLNANGDSTGKIEHKKAVKWTYAIAKCVETLHEVGMAHGEIGPKNFGVNRQGFWKILSVGSIIAREKAEGVIEDGEVIEGDGHKRRGSFGSVPNMSPVKSPSNKVHVNAMQAKDMADFGRIVCKLFGVKEEDVMDRTATAKIQRKHRKAPFELLQGCFDGSVTANYLVKAEYFSQYLTKKGAKRPSSTRSNSSSATNISRKSGVSGGGGSGKVKGKLNIFSKKENVDLNSMPPEDDQTVGTHTSSF